MPGKIWTSTTGGGYEAAVRAGSSRARSPRDIALANDLDLAIDRTLDEAERLRSRLGNPNVADAFTRAWAVGRALLQTGIREHPALAEEEPGFLWEVMAAKARAGVRADGTAESAWRPLRPGFDPERPTQREGGRKGEDYWAMCTWLAEQDYGDAVITFGGSIRNVWQMLDRPTLRPLVLRRALRSWLDDLPEDHASNVTSTRVFPEVMKALVQRWPARGRRSAMQPIHYEEGELRDEIEHVALPLVSLNPR